MLEHVYDFARHLQQQAHHLKAYDEFQTFRAPRVASRKPVRDEALDDLHRTLYGSLHPAAAIVESDRELVEGDGEGEGGAASWIESNALTAAIAVVGAFAVFAWLKRPKIEPLHGPADVPLTSAANPAP